MIRLLSILTILATALLQTSCGAEYSSQKQQLEDGQHEQIHEQIPPEQAQPKADEFTEEEKKWIAKFGEEPEGDLMIRGYISPYEIIVDGVPYSDSEEFYTSLMNKLEEEKAASEQSDYALKLNAQIGIQDLKKGMTVIVLPKGDQGYAAEDSIDWEGKFSTRLPKDIEGEKYIIRAAKKIDVVLSKGGHEIKWCYNLTAVKTVEASADSRPHIISSFETKITRYKCDLDNPETLDGLSFEHKEEIAAAAEDFLNSLKEEQEEQ